MTTTTIEAEATTRIPAARPQAERAVFVTEDDSRSRRLRQAAIAAGALACLWCAGLGIGALGLGRLPGVSLSIPGRGGDQPTRDVDRSSNVGRAQSRSTPQLAAAGESIALEARRRAAIPPASSQTHQARATPPASASRNAQGTPLPATPSSQPAQPATRPVPRGLARRDLTAPPGQTKREPRPQPPAQPPGQARRVDDQQAIPDPLPPGQLKPDKPPPPKG